jgi:hypothetical protein
VGRFRGGLLVGNIDPTYDAMRSNLSVSSQRHLLHRMALVEAPGVAGASALADGIWLDTALAGDFWDRFRLGKAPSAASQVDAMHVYFAQEASCDTVCDLRAFFKARTRAQSGEEIVKAGGKELWVDAIGSRLGISFVSTNVPPSAMWATSKTSSSKTGTARSNVPRIHQATHGDDASFERLGDVLTREDQLEKFFPSDEEIAEVLEKGTPMPPYENMTRQTRKNAQNIIDLLYKKAVKEHANAGSSAILFKFIDSKLLARGYMPDNSVPWHKKAFYRWKMGRRSPDLLQRMYPKWRLMEEGEEMSEDLKGLIDSNLYVGGSSNDVKLLTDKSDFSVVSDDELTTQHTIANSQLPSLAAQDQIENGEVEMLGDVAMHDADEDVDDGVEVQIGMDGVTAPLSTAPDANRCGGQHDGPNPCAPGRALLWDPFPGRGHALPTCVMSSPLMGDHVRSVMSLHAGPSPPTTRRTPARTPASLWTPKRRRGRPLPVLQHGPRKMRQAAQSAVRSHFGFLRLLS